MSDFGLDASRVLESELDIADESRVGKDMVVVKPTAPNEVLGKKDLAIEAQDIIEDYTIVRKSLHDTLEQTQEILKAASELVKESPDPNNFKAVAELVKMQLATTENLFDLHIKISKEIDSKNKSKAKEEDTEFSVDDILNQKDT